MIKTRHVGLFAAVVTLGWLTSVSNRAVAAEPTTEYLEISFTGDLAAIYCDPSDSSALRSLFDQTALTKATAELAKVMDVAERGDLLYRLGASYACLGETERASDFFSQALQIMPQIEDVRFRTRLLMRMANIYSDKLNDIAGMDAALTQALAAVRDSPDPTIGRDVLVQSSFLYIDAGNYERLPAVIDAVSDETLKVELLQTISDQAFYSAESNAEIEQIRQYFPDDLISEISPEPESQSLPLTNYLYGLSLQPGLAEAENASALLDEFIADKTSQIDDLPVVFSIAIASSMFVFVFSESAEPDLSLPYLTQAAQDLPTLQVDTSLPPMQVEALESFFTQAHLSVGLTLIIQGQTDQGRDVITALVDEPVQSLEKHSLLLSMAEVGDTLSSAETEFLLSEAERLLPNIEAQWRPVHQLRTAEAYANGGNTDSSQRLAMPLVAQLSATDAMIPQLSQLPVLFITLGEYDQAIAIAQLFPDESVLTGLPAELLRNGQESLALDVLDSFSAVRDRANAISRLMVAYGQLNRLEDALPLAEKGLQDIQALDLSTDEDYLSQVELGDYDDSQLGFVADSARQAMAVEILFPLSSLLNEASRASANAIAGAPDADVGEAFAQIEDAASSPMLQADQQQSLLATIEDPTLRIGSALSVLYGENVLNEIGNDADAIAALDLPDYLLIRLVSTAVENDRLTQALTFLQEVRSPYARSLALTYLNTSDSAEMSTPEAINQLRQMTLSN